MKRFAALFITLLFFASALTACGGLQEKTGSPEPMWGDCTLNEDPLSEIGMTHEQLVEKHGPEVEPLNPPARNYETGYGSYYFEGGKCVEIASFGASNLFKGLPEQRAVHAAELAPRFGIQYLKSVRDGAEGGRSFFTADGCLIEVGGYRVDLVSKFSYVSVTDLAYENAKDGLPAGIPSQYQFFGGVAIGIPADATVEGFLSDPLIQAWDKNVFVLKDKKVITSGKLTPDMTAWINGYYRPFVPYVE